MSVLSTRRVFLVAVPVIVITLLAVVRPARRVSPTPVPPERPSVAADRFLQGLMCRGIASRDGSRVNLRGPDVTDAVIRGIASLSDFDTLDLDDTRLTRAGWDALGEHARLRCLKIKGDSNADFDAIGRLATLERIVLVAVPLREGRMKRLASLPRLQSMTLHECSLYEADFADLQGLPLKKIELYDSPLRDDHLAAIGRLTTLETLSVQGMRLPTLSWLTPLTRLKGLGLSGCRLEKDVLPTLPTLAALRSLDLNSCYFAKGSELTLPPLPNLRSLSLSSLNISEAEARGLASHASLETLWLYRAGLDDAGLRHLATLPQVRYIMLDGTEVGDLSIDVLAGWKSLTAAHLSGTHVTRGGVERLEAVRPDLQVPSFRSRRENMVAYCGHYIEAIGVENWLSRPADALSPRNVP